jgi:hypothetical protein
VAELDNLFGRLGVNPFLPTLPEDKGTIGPDGWTESLPSGIQTLAAATAILADAGVVQIDCVGAVTSTAAPTIADGSDGQMLMILNVDTADTYTLSDQGTLASSNLRLTANTVGLGPRRSIQLMFSATIGDWVQVGNLVSVL